MTASQDFEIVVVEMGVSQCMFPVVQDWTHVDHFMSQLIPRFAARSRTFPFCSGPTTACTSRVHQRSVRTLECDDTSTYDQQTVTQEADKLLR